jgi:hypothetical protein
MMLIDESILYGAFYTLLNNKIIQNVVIVMVLSRMKALLFLYQQVKYLLKSSHMAMSNQCLRLLFFYPFTYVLLSISLKQSQVIW